MNVGLAVLHIVVGVLFVGHGAQKLFGAFGGHGLEGTAGFFESIGLRPARVHASAAGMAETGGGALLALGLLTPLGAALVTAVMTAAILTVHAQNGLWVTQNGSEYNLVLVAAVFALAAVGSGTVSLDSALGLDVAGTGWALGALGAGLLAGLGAVLSGRLVGARSPVDTERASTA
jgi:putative oxidoreductase